MDHAINFTDILPEGSILILEKAARIISGVYQQTINNHIRKDYLSKLSKTAHEYLEAAKNGTEADVFSFGSFIIGCAEEYTTSSDLGELRKLIPKDAELGRKQVNAYIDLCLRSIRQTHDFEKTFHSGFSYHHRKKHRGGSKN